MSRWLGSDTELAPSGELLKVLDVGSYDVNGSYKPLFDPERFQYTGLDMASGPNVDLVPKSPYSWRELADDAFDVVVSGQALEHVEFFWLVVAEMVRVTREGGLICIVVPRGFDEHRYPVDCYRFLADGMVAIARYVNLEVLHAHCDCQPDGSSDSDEWHLDFKEDSLLIARKPYAGLPRLIDVENYQCEPADLETLRAPLVSHDSLVSQDSLESSEASEASSSQPGEIVQESPAFNADDPIPKQSSLLFRILRRILSAG